jgi:glycosyltransferase involved in cell wall biosynthesis
MSRSVSRYETLTALLIDPALFTAPYDNALSGGLLSNAVRPHWVTRPLRANEERELTKGEISETFYALTDGARRRTSRIWKFIKGFEHLIGLKSVIWMAREGHIDLVHMQWLVIPVIDGWAIKRLQRYCPVVLTVHDTTPFNGKAVSLLQRFGFFRTIQTVDHVIVHTERGAEALSRHVDPAKVSVIPHGILTLRQPKRVAPPARTDRWRIVQFGRIQHYKGVDLLVEALGRMSQHDRARISVLVAGEPSIDMAPLLTRAAALGLTKEVIEFRLERQSEAEISEILADADAFVFPYREIEASGVLFLVAPYKKWIVASRIGTFFEIVGDDLTRGELFPANDIGALAAALSNSIGKRPSRDLASNVPSWDAIGAMTRSVYDVVLSQRETSGKRE